MATSRIRTSFIRTSIAGIVLAGGVFAGTAGVASAATGATGGTGQRPSAEQVCARLTSVRDRITAAESRLDTRLAQLQTAYDKAVEAGKTEAAAKLAERITKVQQLQAKLSEKVDVIDGRIAERCTSAPAPAPAGA
jgi:hypothetical protein